MYYQNFHFTLSDAVNLLELPVMSECVKMTIEDFLKNVLVLPNRIVIPMFTDSDLIDINNLRKPHPKVKREVLVNKFV